MKSWPRPSLPAIPGRGAVPRLVDSATGQRLPAALGQTIGIYVCGITPYDATHLGHAATYVTFDILHRAARDAGLTVRVVQNVTDVDDPLFERAARDGIDWRELGQRENDLFREDMTALAVIPPDEYVGVEESMADIAAAVERLVASGAAYAVPIPGTTGSDLYLDLAQRLGFGSVSGWTEDAMDEVFAERGGDPDRAGKRSRFDPPLWRAARVGEPSWDHPTLGPGRPGWHIECTAITLDHLGIPFDVKGGGSDLIFPHHEMGAAQAEALVGGSTFARVYVHQGMVGFEGHKMSKSRGNLVLVSQLRAAGVDPMAIRLTLLAHHHREDWEYTVADLDRAQARLSNWRAALSGNTAVDSQPLVDAVRAALADDLDTPAAIRAVDAWVEATGSAEAQTTGPEDATAAGVVARALDALLGIRL